MGQQEQFNQLCSDAGTVPSETNDYLKSGLDGLDALIRNTEDRAKLLDIRSAFQAGAESNSKCGLRIQAIKDFGDQTIYKTAPAQKPVLPPGMTVADFGSDVGEYTGKVDPALLTLKNKSYIANHLDQVNPTLGQTFSGPIVWGDPEVPGNTYDAGTLMAGDQDPIVRDGKGRTVYNLAK